MDRSTLRIISKAGFVLVFIGFFMPFTLNQNEGFFRDFFGKTQVQVNTLERNAVSIEKNAMEKFFNAAHALKDRLTAMETTASKQNEELFSGARTQINTLEQDVLAIEAEGFNMDAINQIFRALNSRLVTMERDSSSQNRDIFSGFFNNIRIPVSTLEQNVSIIENVGIIDDAMMDKISSASNALKNEITNAEIRVSNKNEEFFRDFFNDTKMRVETLEQDVFAPENEYADEEKSAIDDIFRTVKNRLANAEMTVLMQNRELFNDFFSEAGTQVYALEENALIFNTIHNATHSLKGGLASVETLELNHNEKLLKDFAGNAQIQVDPLEQNVSVFLILNNMEEDFSVAALKNRFAIMETIASNNGFHNGFQFIISLISKINLEKSDINLSMMDQSSINEYIDKLNLILSNIGFISYIIFFISCVGTALFFLLLFKKNINIAMDWCFLIVTVFMTILMCIYISRAAGFISNFGETAREFGMKIENHAFSFQFGAYMTIAGLLISIVTILIVILPASRKTPDAV